MNDMKLKTIASLVATLLVSISASNAFSQTASSKEALYTRSLAASCANCHGTDGRTVSGSPVASLAGMDKIYFIAQMNAFKAGTQPATVMHQLSKGFNDAQVEALASYFAALQK